MIDDDNNLPEPAPSEADPALLLLFTIVAAAGLALMALVLYGATWLAEQFALAEGGDWSSFAWPVVVAIHGAAVAIPAALLARSRWPARYQAVFKTWALSGLFVFFTIPQHLVGPTAALSGALLQIAAAALFLLGWAIWQRRQNVPRSFWPPTRGPYWPVLLVTPLIIWPWLIYGSLGSGLDLLLNLAAGLMLGLVAALIARRHLLPGLAHDAVSSRAAVGLGGLALAGSLVTIGTAFGINGQQLILLFLLPALAWLAMGLISRAPADSLVDGWLIQAMLIGLVAAAPLVLVDPDEMLLVLNLGTRDIGAWAVNATLISVAIALLLGLVGVFLVGRPTPLLGKAAGRALAGLSWIGLFALYLTVGQPGWHGDQIFVVMDAQPVLPARGEMAYWPYRTLVYETLTEQADDSQADLRATLDGLGVSYRPYYLVNGLEVDGGPLLRWWLSRRDDVDRVLDNPELRPLPAPPPSSTGDLAAPDAPLWNLTTINAPRVWSELGVTGERIVIGQSDSGVEGTHPELASTYRGATSAQAPGDAYNWLDPWNQTPSPSDTGGHGTHTLGSVVGQNVGVAPGASWIGCVNLDRNLANPARYLDCMQFLFAPFPQDGDPFADGRAELGAHIFNNSWACPPLEGCDPESLQAAVEALRQAGVFFVTSAGNSGSECGSVSDPPAIYEAVFSVGATDASGAVAPFSSRGPVDIDGSGRVKPDIAAPGVDVLSAVPGGGYAEFSGTSMASPHVAGVVALLWSANPDLIGDIGRTETILADTAQPFDYALHGPPACGSESERPNNATGYGIVDALAATRLALDAAGQ